MEELAGAAPSASSTLDAGRETCAQRGGEGRARCLSRTLPYSLRGHWPPPMQDIIEADHALKIVCLGALCCRYGGCSVLPAANFVVTILQSWTIFLTESPRNIFVKDPPNKFIKQFFFLPRGFALFFFPRGFAL
jgi:hypothetical protein